HGQRSARLSVEGIARGARVLGARRLLRSHRWSGTALHGEGRHPRVMARALSLEADHRESQRAQGEQSSREAANLGLSLHGVARREGHRQCPSLVCGVIVPPPPTAPNAFVTLEVTLDLLQELEESRSELAFLCRGPDHHETSE